MAPKLIIAPFALVALLWPRPATAPIAASQAPVDTVTVEHELIRVPPLRPPVPAPAVRPSRPAPVKLVAEQKPANQVPPHGMVQRAKRVLLGDGRYRPEPFPRPGR